MGSECAVKAVALVWNQYMSSSSKNINKIFSKIPEDPELEERTHLNLALPMIVSKEPITMGSGGTVEGTKANLLVQVRRMLA